MSKDPYSAYYAPPAAELDASSRRPERPHGGLGIASFLLSLLVGFGEVALVAAAGYMQKYTPGGMTPDDPKAQILGLLILGGLMVAFLGACLGLGGLFQKDRKRLFAVLGLVFNGMILMAVFALMVIGMVIQSHHQGV